MWSGGGEKTSRTKTSHKRQLVDQDKHECDYYLFGFFGILAVLSAAVDVPSDVVNVGKVPRTFLLLQLGQDRRLSLWEGRHLF